MQLLMPTEVFRATSQSRQISPYFVPSANASSTLSLPYSLPNNETISRSHMLEQKTFPSMTENPLLKASLEGAAVAAAPNTAGPSPASISQHKPCSRCQQTSSATHPVRRDTFCGSCLQIWILARLAKRTAEGFRIPGGGRDSVRRILLPLSGGASSLALLHLLDLHVNARLARTGRAGYEVLVLWVDQSVLLPQGENGEGFTESAWDLLRQRYSTRWRIERIGIEEVFSPNSPLGDSERQDLLSALPHPTEALQTSSPAEKLTSLLKALPEPSSRSDLLTSLRLRLIVAFAQQQACSIIAWGDTTTRLAEKTLAETAKGRGYSLPWQTGDRETPYAGLKFMYPLQDVYRREIQLWASTASEPPLGDLLGVQSNTTEDRAVAPSSRNLTIDELMKRYFEGVEVAYPSVVANVVRTSNKLEAPSEASSAGASLLVCAICGLAYNSAAGDLTAWEGNQMEIGMETATREQRGSDAGGTAREASLCYACHRTLSKARVGQPA